MSYKIGQKIRIKHNAIEIIKKHNKKTGGSHVEDSYHKKALEGTIRVIKKLSDELPQYENCITITNTPFSVFPIEAIEPYYDEREIMLDIEKVL